MVSSCPMDVVEPSRSMPGEEAESDSGRGGVEVVERLGNPGMDQLVEERRIAVPTRERKVFLEGGGVVDIVPSQLTGDPDVFEKS